MLDAVTMTRLGTSSSNSSRNSALTFNSHPKDRNMVTHWSIMKEASNEQCIHTIRVVDTHYNTEYTVCTTTPQYATTTVSTTMTMFGWTDSMIGQWWNREKERTHDFHEHRSIPIIFGLPQDDLWYTDYSVVVMIDQTLFFAPGLPSVCTVILTTMLAIGDKWCTCCNLW